MDIRSRLRAIAAGTSSESAESVHTQSSVRQRLRALAEGGGSTEPADPAFRRTSQLAQNAPTPGTAAMEKIKGWQNTKKAESNAAAARREVGTIVSDPVQAVETRRAAANREIPILAKNSKMSVAQNMMQTGLESRDTESSNIYGQALQQKVQRRQRELDNAADEIPWDGDIGYTPPEAQTDNLEKATAAYENWLRRKISTSGANELWDRYIRDGGDELKREIMRKTGFDESMFSDAVKSVKMSAGDIAGDLTGQVVSGAQSGLQSAAQQINNMFWSDVSIALSALGFNTAAKKTEEWAKNSYNVDVFGANKMEQRLQDKYADKHKSSPLIFAEGVANSAGGMLPAIAAGSAAGMAGASANAAEIANFIVFGSSAAGNATKQALEEGASFGDAVQFGIYSGFLEVFTEKMFAGIAGMNTTGVAKEMLGKAPDTFAKGLYGSVPGINSFDTMLDTMQLTGKVPSVFNTLSKIMTALKSNGTMRLLTDIFGEGVEEVVSEYLTPYIKRATYDPEAAPAEISALLESFASGAALSIIMEGASATVNGGIRGLVQSRKGFEEQQVLRDDRSGRTETVELLQPRRRQYEEDGETVQTENVGETAEEVPSLLMQILQRVGETGGATNSIAEIVMSDPASLNELSAATNVDLNSGTKAQRRAAVKNALNNYATAVREVTQNQPGDSSPASQALNDGNDAQTLDNGNNEQQENAVELQRRSPNNIVLPELPGEMPGGKVWPGDVGTQNQRDPSPAAQTLDDGMADGRRQRAAKAEDETERTGILAGVKDEYIQLARRLGKATGRSIVFFDEAAGENGGMNNGFYNPDDGSLHVNARSGNPVAQIISHELTHSIEDSGFYDKLSRLVFDRMRREGADISTLRQAKRELYEKNGVELEGYGEVDAELVAEYVEKNLLTDEAAIRAVVDYDRTLGQRILDFLNNLLGKLGSKSARERLFISRARRYYQAALEETQESSARAGQTVAEQEGNISRIGERLRSGELTDEQAEAIFNETYDPELDLRRNGAAEESRRRYSFAGENSRTADLDALERAKQLREAGVADETILRETGWYVGADGKWRYEIDDSGMKYNASGENRGADRSRTLREYNRYFKALTEHEMTSAQRRELADYIHKADRGEFDEALYNRLAEAFGNDFENFAGVLEARRESADYSEGKTVGDYISHSALFDAYPQLRDMKLEFETLDEGVNGYYSRANNAIVIDRSLRGAPEETLLHEIQHAIQNIADFTGGASPKYWKNKINRAYLDFLNAKYAFTHNKEIAELDRRIEMGELDEEWYGEELENILNRNLDARQKYEAMQKAERFANIISSLGTSSIDLYNNTAGEIEARDASVRRNLTAEERRNRMPDRGDENTVFADGDGRSYSIANTRNMPWDEQVDKYFRNDGSIKSSDSLYLGESDVTGVEKAPVYIPTSVINKAIRTPKGSRSAHSLSKQDIKRLGLGVKTAPAVIYNPSRNSIVYVTENQDSTGNYIVATVDLNNNLFGENAHKVTSIHGREDISSMFGKLDSQAVIYVNNENKLNQMLPSKRILKSPQLQAKVEFNTRNITDNSDSVNSKFSITEETPSESKTKQREDEYQAALNGFPQINGVQIVPYKTWVHATDIMSDEHGNILRDANGEARRRDNYGIVTGLDSGMPGRLLVSFRNDEYGTRANNVSIAPEDLEPVSKYKYAAEKAFEDAMEQEPLEPANEQLSAEEQAEIENMRRAAEQREDTERATQQFEPTTREALNNKARSYLERVERSLVNRVANAMSVPRFARREYLNEIAQRISDEYLSEGRVKNETANELFEKAYNEGIIVDEEFYQEYKPVKDHLRTQAVTISEGDRQSIPDFNNFRRRAFGSLKIVNEGGIPVDSAYQELREIAPELFPEDITHPADRLVRMLEVAQSIQKTEKSLSEYYGEDAAEFKKWARNDFDDAINSSISELRNVRRYANDVAAKGEKAKRPTLTVQQAKDAYVQLKKARWEMEKVKAKNLLTDADNIQLGRLLRGEIQPEHLDPGRDNVRGIIAVYEASVEYEKLVQQINDYKQSVRAQAAAKADEYLKTANRWKDKAIGLAYARETMERNIEDIVPDKKLAADIIREYITPVHDAEAAATRFKNQMRDRVRKLELGIKPTKGNEVSEAYAVQLLGEAEDNIRVLRESRGRLERRDGKTAEEWAAEIAELKEHNPSMDWGKIENAVGEFRKIYDELIDRLNEARVRNGYEPINYRSGYFPHFQAGEDGGALARMGRALGITTGVETLPTTINGLTSQFKPGIRWFSAAQERRGYNTVYDAVQGFERYINGAADVIFHTDNIQALRALANQIRKRTSDEGIRAQINEVEKSTELTEEQKDELKKQIYESGRYSLSNFVAELDEYTNLLAGKKSKYDRAMEAMLGRRAYTVMKNVEARVGANMIVGNMSSALTNFIPLAQAWGQIDTRSMLQGMWQTLKSIKDSDGMVDASSFLTSRRGSDPVVQSWTRKASTVLNKPMEFIDSFTTGSIIRARYAQNLRHGMSEAAAISEADAFAARVIADRSKGSLPTLFESKNPLFKAFSQFQLEVNNQFSEVFKDLPKIRRDKGLKALAAALFKYFIGLYMFNELYEFIFGRRPALDPLGILNDTVGDFTGYELPNLIDLGIGAITGDMPSFKAEKQPVGTSIQNLGNNILGELPFSSGLNLLGIDVDGGRLPAASAIPDVANILTAATKSGVSGKKRAKTILDELMKPAVYLLPPFGGNQAQKIWKSVYALSQGGSYTMDNEGNAKLQYPIYSDDKGSYALDFSRMLLFGKSSLKEAREWAENNYNTLSAKQTAAYQDMVDNGENQRKAYDVVDELRQAEKTDEQTKKYVQCEILRGADISGESRAIAYRTLLASDKEAELMDSFDAGTDLGQITNVLIDMYEVKKTDGKLAVLADAGLTKDETISFLAYLMGDELYTKNGNKTQFAKMQLCLDAGMSVKEVIGAKLNGESFDKILKEFGATENSDSGWASPWGNSGEDGWESPWGKQDENGWASPWN